MKKTKFQFLSTCVLEFPSSYLNEISVFFRVSCSPLRDFTLACRWLFAARGWLVVARRWHVLARRGAQVRPVACENIGNTTDQTHTKPNFQTNIAEMPFFLSAKPTKNDYVGCFTCRYGTNEGFVKPSDNRMNGHKEKIMITEEIQTIDPVSEETESQSVEVNGIPIDPEMMFSNAKGVYKKGIEKRQRKLLAKIGFLKPFLEPDEQVILVTAGCSPMSSLEQLLGGAIIFTLKRALFIFTDRRVFHVPTKPNLAYRGSIAHFLYTDCKSIKISGRTLVVKYHYGSAERFYYIRGSELANLKHLFKNTPMPEPETEPSRRVHLCPQCSARLQRQVYVCSGCGQPFKNRKTAQKLSMLVPGGGYFYVGHWGLGILDALVETFLSLQFLYVCVFYAMTLAPEALSGVFLFGAILTMEKLITVFQTNQFIDEYIPIKGKAS